MSKRWSINPETFRLDGPGGRMSAQEFAAVERPPCPVCGTTIHVERVNVQGRADRFPVFIRGPWQCPNECDPRSPREDHTIGVTRL
jgi:hypothetical protein